MPEGGQSGRPDGPTGVPAGHGPHNQRLVRGVSQIPLGNRRWLPATPYSWRHRITAIVAQFGPNHANRLQPGGLLPPPQHLPLARGVPDRGTLLFHSQSNASKSNVGSKDHAALLVSDKEIPSGILVRSGITNKIIDDRGNTIWQVPKKRTRFD